MKITKEMDEGYSKYNNFLKKIGIDKGFPIMTPHTNTLIRFSKFKETSPEFIKLAMCELLGSMREIEE